MSDISLLKAFSILFNGSDYQIGEGHHWKRGALMLAMALTAIFPILNFWNSQSYAGAEPPDVPLIKSIGSITVGKYNPRGIIRQYNVNFHAGDGKIYYLMDDAIGPDELKTFELRLNFNVEGFLLQDGRGFFWPTLITGPDGHILLDPEKSSRILNSNRDPFGKLLLLEYASTLPLWIISLLNAIKLRKKFTEEIK
jgi:hypothetical protein